MKFELHGEEVKKWNSVCEIIEVAAKHEPHAQPGRVQIRLEDEMEVTITYESAIFAIQATVELEEKEAESIGSVSVPSATFGVFGQCSKKKLTVSEKNSQLVFKAGRSSNKVGLIEDFEVNDIYASDMAEVSFPQLLSAVEKVKASLKKDKHRDISDKINFFSREKGKTMMCFATDGHRIFAHYTSMVNPIREKGFAIHMGTVNGLIEILEHYKDASVQMWDIQDNHIYLVAPDVCVRIPTLQAMQQDPNFFRETIIGATTSDVTVSMKGLKSALKKCGTAQALKKRVVKGDAVTEQGAIMFLEHEALILGVAGPGFEMIEDIDPDEHRFDPKVEDMCRASFRIKYLQESLREISSKSVRLRWSGVDGKHALQAVLINGVGEDDSYSILMMVRPEKENNAITPDR